jgi:hypothetical protein
MLPQLPKFVEGTRAIGEGANVGLDRASVNLFLVLCAMSLQFKGTEATLVGANEWPHIDLRDLVMKEAYMRL